MEHIWNIFDVMYANAGSNDQFWILLRRTQSAKTLKAIHIIWLDAKAINCTDKQRKYLLDEMQKRIAYLNTYDT